MSSLPSDLNAAGTFAASAWSTDVAAPLVVSVVPPPVPLLPHAATTMARPRPRATSRHLRALPNISRPYRPGRRAAPQRPLLSDCLTACHTNSHAAHGHVSGQFVKVRVPDQRVVSSACADGGLLWTRGAAEARVSNGSRS